MSVGRIAIESPRNRSYECVNDDLQEAACYEEAEDYDYGRKVQREAAEIQRRDPTPDGQHDRVHHRPDGVVDHLKEPRRRVAGEPTDQDPRDDEPEQDVKCIVHHGREQRAYAKPKPLQEEGESHLQRRRHYLASPRACSVAASTPSYTAATKPAFSIAANAAAVVPPGVVTSSRIWYAAFSLSKT